MATLVCGLLAVAAFAAFAEALRRYAVGVGGPIDYLQGSWQPPFGATALTIAAFVLIALMALFVRHLVAAQPVPGDPGRRPRIDLVAAARRRRPECPRRESTCAPARTRRPVGTPHRQDDWNRELGI